MKYWKAECGDGSSQEVTNVKNVRECKVVVERLEQMLLFKSG